MEKNETEKKNKKRKSIKEEKLKKEKELLEQMKSADNADQTIEQQNALAREIEATSQKLNEYKSQLNQTDNALEDVTQETQEASQHTLTFGDIVKANLVSEVIIQGIRKIAEGIKDISLAALNVGMEFESSMSQVAATMGMTTAEIEAGSDAYNTLAEAAKQCGATTMYTASQAADALNYLALAGYDAYKAAETLPKVLTLAAAGGMDLAYASDLITDAMSAMGMSTEDLDKYLDEMTRTAQKANTSVAQLGEATLVCAGTVTLTGQSLETMNTELGILANNGIKGAEGGTHLRNILLSLSAPTDKASDAIKSLGLTISDSQGNMRDLNDIMLDLNAALEGMGTADKASVIKSIFNKTDIAAVNALMKGSVEEFGNLKAKIEDCEGAAQAMADTMMDNLEGKVTILKSALEGLGVTFYDIFDEDAKKAVGAATDAVDRLQDAMKNGELGMSLEELSEAFGDLADDLIHWAEDALPDIIDGTTWFIDNLPQIIDILESVGLAVAAYKVATLAATVATEGFGLALSTSLGPIGLIAAGVAGLTAAFVTLENTAAEEANKFPRAIQENVDALENVKTSYAESSSKANELARTIKELNSVEHLNADQKIALASAVQEWNSIVGENNQLIIDETGHIQDNTDALYDNIDAALEAYELELKKEELTELTKKYAEAKELEAQAEKERAEAYEEYLAVQGNDYDRERQNLSILQQKGEQLRECRDNTREYAQEYENLTNEIRESTEQQKASNDAMRDGVSASGELGSALEELQETIEKEQESLEKLVEGQVASFEKLKEASATSKEDVIENLQSNVEAMEDWADNMQTLAERGIDDGLLKYLANMGPEGAAQVQEFVDMTGDELEKAGGLWREALNAENLTDDLVAEYETLGTNATQAYIDGAWVPIEDGTLSKIPEGMVDGIVQDANWERLPEEVKTKIVESLTTTSEELADDESSAGGIPESLVDKIVEDENWERLPEEVKENIINSLLEAQEGIVDEDETGTIIADNIDDGFIEETQARAPEVQEAIQTGVVDPVIDTMNEQFQTGEGLPSQVFVDYGMNFVASLKQGVETNTPLVLLPALAKMCDDSLLQIQTSLGWDGSKFLKFYEVGIKVDESIAKGIEDSTEVISSALQTALDEAVNSIDFGGLSSKINEALGSALAG